MTSSMTPHIIVTIEDPKIKEHDVDPSKQKTS
jgi:hypothetical protein